MKKRIYNPRTLALTLALAAVAVTQPARSADVVGEEPPVPATPVEVAPLNTWDGIYAGVTAAYGFGEADHTQPAPGGFDTDGFHGGVFIGYQMQSGAVVWGGEADLGYGTISGTNGATALDYGVDGTVRARLGYTPHQAVLFYATGGLAAARLEAVEGGVADTRTVVGWTAGAGVDVNISQDVFGRIEYRYTDFGSETFATGTGANVVDTSDSRVMFGLGLKF